MLREKVLGCPTYLIPGTEREELWKFSLFENKNNDVSPQKASHLIRSAVAPPQRR